METLFQDILQKKNKWFILLILGLLLVVIAMPATETKTGSEEKYALEEELRLKNILEQMEGVGRTKIMITYQDSKTVEGVVVIAEGAENTMVVRRIMDVVQALFDVDLHRIKVMKGNQSD